MIWFIIIYGITLILWGIFIYTDMYKGETLEHYLNNLGYFNFVVMIL